MSSEPVPWFHAALIPQEEAVRHYGREPFQTVRLTGLCGGDDCGVLEVEALSERETCGERNSPWSAEVPVCEGCAQHFRGNLDGLCVGIWELTGLFCRFSGIAISREAKRKLR